MIAPILSDLVNEVVHQDIYPDFLKVVRVTPIHKSGSKFDFKNCRPLSVLPFLNKVFERALHYRLISFFYRFIINYEDQYGFLKNKSTSDAILKFTQEFCSSSNKKEHLISVFLYVSKALNTISHFIIFKKKLQKSGIRDNQL